MILEIIVEKSQFDTGHLSKMGTSFALKKHRQFPSSQRKRSAAKGSLSFQAGFTTGCDLGHHLNLSPGLHLRSLGAGNSADAMRAILGPVIFR